VREKLYVVLGLIKCQFLALRTTTSDVQLRACRIVSESWNPCSPAVLQSCSLAVLCPLRTSAWRYPLYNQRTLKTVPNTRNAVSFGSSGAPEYLLLYCMVLVLLSFRISFVSLPELLSLSHMSLSFCDSCSQTSATPSNLSSLFLFLPIWL